MIIYVKEKVLRASLVYPHSNWIVEHKQVGFMITISLKTSANIRIASWFKL